MKRSASTPRFFKTGSRGLAAEFCFCLGEQTALNWMTGDHRRRGHRFDCRPLSGRREAPGADPTITSPEAV